MCAQQCSSADQQKLEKQIFDFCIKRTVTLGVLSSSSDRKRESLSASEKERDSERLGERASESFIRNNSP
jgi:hypothetical protein